MTIDDVLAWNNLLQLQMVDQKDKPAVDKGTIYVPLRGCSDIDPSTTYCHGTPLSSLLSILATGVVRGSYYTELSSLAIWTATDPPECFSYSPYVHIGGGRWVRVMVHFDKDVVEAPDHMRGLGSSRHQIAIKSAFSPFCGVSFQFKNFRELAEGKDKLFVTKFMSVPPNWEADTWAPLLEVHPFELSAIMLEAVFPVEGSNFGRLRYLGEEDEEGQEVEGTGLSDSAPSTAAPSAGPGTAAAKASNPENVTKADILREIPGIVWACGDQDYGLNRDPPLFYGCHHSPTWNDPCARLQSFRLSLKRMSVTMRAGGLPCIVPKIATADASGPWNMWMQEFRKCTHSYSIRFSLTPAGMLTPGRTMLRH